MTGPLARLRSISAKSDRWWAAAAAGAFLAACSSSYNGDYSAHTGVYESEESYSYTEDSLEGDVARPVTVQESRAESTSSRDSYKSAQRMPASRPASRPPPGYSQPKPQVGPQQSQQTGGQPSPLQPGKQVQPAKVMMVYQGQLQLRVRRQLEAMTELTAMAKALDGFVQSQSGNVLVLRVPVAKFFAAMDQLSAVGKVLDRSYQAQDVGDRVAELETRLQVVTEARERLLALLAKTKDSEQRLAILEEVKRLTEVLETLQSTVQTLTRLAAFSTITVQVEPLLQDGGSGGPRSFFAWIRNLQSHRATLGGGKDDLTLPMPKGFVQFHKDDDFRAQAADTSALRAGKIRNEPVGTAAFWAEAIAFEMEGRDEEKVDRFKAGPLEVQVFRNKDAQPRWYLVGVTVAGDDVYVVEAWLPDEAAWKLHGDAIRDALGKLEVQP